MTRRGTGPAISTSPRCCRVRTARYTRLSCPSWAEIWTPGSPRGGRRGSARWSRSPVRAPSSTGTTRRAPTRSARISFARSRPGDSASPSSCAAPRTSGRRCATRPGRGRSRGSSPITDPSRATFASARRAGRRRTESRETRTPTSRRRTRRFAPESLPRRRGPSRCPCARLRRGWCATATAKGECTCRRSSPTISRGKPG